jgi:FKBP-type peptidyl-prolyl cis-trans isomerase
MRIKVSSLLIIVAITGTIIYSCKKTTSQIQRDQEVDYLRRYVAKYLPGIKPTSSGLYYQELKAGIDTFTIRTGDVVKLFYTGYLIQDTIGLGIKTGKIFDASGDYEPFSFKVGGGAVITGWDEAIRLMKNGGEAIWVIPSRDAYSAQPQASIPAYSPLVFHISIYRVYRSVVGADTIKHLIINNPPLHN